MNQFVKNLITTLILFMSYQFEGGIERKYKVLKLVGTIGRY